MATHRLHDQRQSFYFVTLTCFRWLNLLDHSKTYDYLPFWFSKIDEAGCSLNGYVIMPNHIHFVIYFYSEDKTLNDIIGTSKRFLAYEIVSRLKRFGQIKLLKVLHQGVQENERKKGKQHQVFRLSFDAELLDPEDVPKVLDHMHRNPVSGKWDLVEDYLDYPYSSARYYELGVRDMYLPLVDYRKVASESSSSNSE